MADPTAHYQRLFRRLAREHGKVSEETISSIVGFDAGGPVSMCRVGEVGYVTVELSLYEQQKVSTEGVRFELLCFAGLGEDTVRSMFTALGRLSMSAKLGSGHTVDLAQVLTGIDIQRVRLVLHSRAGLLWPKYGVYEVIPE